MIWEPYVPYKDTPKPSDGHYLGQIANVYLNIDKTLIKRTYNLNGVTVNNNPSEHSAEIIQERWEREYRWINEFNNQFFMPELVDANYEEGWTIQKYYGPDLLIQGFKEVPDIEDQVIRMYTFFRDRNVYKKNGSLSNMTHDNGRLVAFDYKWMVTRDNPNPAHREWEEKSIDLWLSKINPDLIPKLKALL
jgi:hypothetical protein